MSGGVDSSVAALLLQDTGYDVTGVTMALGIHRTTEDAGRFTDESIADAESVCRQLGISHLTFSYADCMEERVIKKFLAEYQAGRTPNPCVDCNRYLKFGALMRKTRELGFDYLATGHYAQIEKRRDGWSLMRPRDKAKDQTYFLYPIRTEDLPFILFPLGALTKEEVRQKAKDAGLHTAHRAESQDICFVPHGDYRRLLKDRNLSAESGNIVDQTGRILGRHSGITNYTIGQRSGLGISAREPLYVLRFHPDKNVVVVGGKEDLLANGLMAGDLNLLKTQWPDEVEAKIRYRKKPARCRVEKDGDKLNVIFFEPQESITPGQAFVFYSGDELLGGGVIEEVVNKKGYHNEQN